MLLLCLVAGTALMIAAHGTTVTLITLPGPRSSRWLDRLVDERDAALFGQQIAFLTGVGLSPREHAGLMPALQAAYAALDEANATAPSPFLSTYLNCQRPAAFDTVVIEPPGGGPAPPPSSFSTALRGTLRCKAGCCPAPRPASAR